MTHNYSEKMLICFFKQRKTKHMKRIEIITNTKISQYEFSLTNWLVWDLLTPSFKTAAALFCSHHQPHFLQPIK